MTQEIGDLLAWSEGDLAIADLTVGGGGHLKYLLERFAKPQRIVALDQDRDALNAAQKNLSTFQIEWVHSNFRNLSNAVTDATFDRIVVDLGVSSFQLDEASRGFSFQKDGPLDMRMNTSEGVPAWEWLAQCDESELADILKNYGEESRAKWFARKWLSVKNREEIRTTKAFVEALGFSLDSRGFKGRHPLTRVFQAIRIHINDEFGALQDLLQKLPEYLKKNGRAAILTFHSLEDREVKWALRGNLKAVNKKVICASREEQKNNPRSRSAKLRVFEK